VIQQEDISSTKEDILMLGRVHLIAIHQYIDYEQMTNHACRFFLFINTSFSISRKIFL